MVEKYDHREWIPVAPTRIYKVEWIDINKKYPTGRYVWMKGKFRKRPVFVRMKCKMVRIYIKIEDGSKAILFTNSLIKEEFDRFFRRINYKSYRSFCRRFLTKTEKEKAILKKLMQSNEILMLLYAPHIEEINGERYYVARIADIILL
ncbi:MAG: hypothetical protein Q6363_010180 [Candidatus Njordarchaeota archaeon]